MYKYILEISSIKTQSEKECGAPENILIPLNVPIQHILTRHITATT